MLGGMEAEDQQPIFGREARDAACALRQTQRRPACARPQIVELKIAGLPIDRIKVWKEIPLQLDEVLSRRAIELTLVASTQP